MKVDGMEFGVLVDGSAMVGCVSGIGRLAIDGAYESDDINVDQFRFRVCR